ncbi:hypothetical protein EIN_019880 [Entamoeba invadens IP1]|uniref:hypothetical protein n=1 Tax=Entamoeba invadens IP1 TaxID=370355 RepID=UPI0002C3CE9D|nr:hypothetical protein EIN_019880 [Entamoeba invadens IP1]ELP90549.1 hypothetical protein EIN_019880 [Entamoeba invadens IP1]|eukprot:XP_004257320.1 hypothetical protein EIN_019880 [Entamoeba invadens IP1]
MGPSPSTSVSSSSIRSGSVAQVIEAKKQKRTKLKFKHKHNKTEMLPETIGSSEEEILEEEETLYQIPDIEDEELMHSKSVFTPKIRKTLFSTPKLFSNTPTPNIDDRSPRFKGTKTPKPRSSKISTPSLNFASPRLRPADFCATPTAPVLHQEKIAFIQKETNKKKFTTIYNSEIDGFDARELSSRVCCQTNTLFVVITDNEQFGFYNEDLIPIVKNETLQVESKDMFLFVLSGRIVQPTSFRRNEGTRSLTLYAPSEKNFVVTCFCAFWVTSDGKIYVHHLIKEMYPGLKNMTSPLIERNVSEKFSCKRLVAIKCE